MTTMLTGIMIGLALAICVEGVAWLLEDIHNECEFKNNKE